MKGEGARRRRNPSEGDGDVVLKRPKNEAQPGSNGSDTGGGADGDRTNESATARVGDEKPATLTAAATVAVTGGGGGASNSESAAAPPPGRVSPNSLPVPSLCQTPPTPPPPQTPAFSLSKPTPPPPLSAPLFTPATSHTPRLTPATSPKPAAPPQDRDLLGSSPPSQAPPPGAAPPSSSAHNPPAWRGNHSEVSLYSSSSPSNLLPLPELRELVFVANS